MISMAKSIYFTYDQEYYDRQELSHNYKSLGTPLFHDHDEHATIRMICVSGIMQQDNNEQVILEPKLIAKQYIRSNPFLAN